ncbi:MAG: ribulose-phosphate 3-epimerase [Firmicutes bacterium]|nr:ribulose-phosphate 3-epimerase [Bacillota bacterium]
MENKRLIAPSILSADFADLKNQIKLIEKADLIHCDVMDGHFVPNLTFGMKMVEDLKKFAARPLDVHLMISNPEKYIKRFIDAGADFLTFHIEAANDIDTCLDMIKQAKIKGGIAISPDTDINLITRYIDKCDIVVLMSVYPGFGGQKFIEKSLQRLTALKKIKDKINPSCLIQVDGGVTKQNAKTIFDHGADILVAGNAVFGATDPNKAIEELKNQN